MVTRIAAAFDKLLNVLAWLAGAMIIFLTVGISYSVVMRYLFKRPPTWMVQVSEYTLLWITFLVAAWLLRERGHITVDIITSQLTERSRKLMGIIMSGVGAAACLVVFWFGAKNTWTCLATNVVEAKVLYIPKAPIIAVIPFGSLLLFIQFIRNMKGDVRKKQEEEQS